MNRELQIIDALVELSLHKSEVDLDLIQATVQHRQKDLLPHTWKQTARQALRTLAGVGMVQIDTDARLRYENVRLTKQFLNTDTVKAAHMNKQESRDGESPVSEMMAERGGGGRRGNDGNGFDEGDGGGEGFREVLAHPYLFSLSKTDFDDILDQI